MVALKISFLRMHRVLKLSKLRLPINHKPTSKATEVVAAAEVAVVVVVVGVGVVGAIPSHVFSCSPLRRFISFSSCNQRTPTTGHYPTPPSFPTHLSPPSPPTSSCNITAPSTLYNTLYPSLYIIPPSTHHTPIIEYILSSPNHSAYLSPQLFTDNRKLLLLCQWWYYGEGYHWVGVEEVSDLTLE